MEKKQRIGKMDRKVGIYTKTTTKSSTGQAVVQEVLYKSTWAAVEDTSSKEEEQGKIYLLAIRKYTVRHDEGLVADGEQMIIKDADGDYHIAQVQQLGRKGYLILKAVKRE